MTPIASGKKKCLAGTFHFPQSGHSGNDQPSQCYTWTQNKQDIMNQNRLLPTRKNLSASGKAITCYRI